MKIFLGVESFSLFESNGLVAYLQRKNSFIQLSETYLEKPFFDSMVLICSISSQIILYELQILLAMI